MTTCDLRHEWVAVYGVKKHLVLQPNWCLLMRFQMSHGLMDGLHEFLSTCADRNVEKIREAILDRTAAYASSCQYLGGSGSKT